MKKETLKQAHELLQQLEVRHLRYELEEFYNSHPSPDSIAFYSDLLKRNGVDNSVVQFNNENYGNFFSIPLPIITYSNSNNGEFLLVDSISKESISYTGFHSRREVVPIEKFLETWQGVVLIPFEKITQRALTFGAKAYDLLYRLSRFTFYLFGVLITFFFFQTKFSISIDLFVITTIVGLFITTLIFLYEERSDSTLIHRICGEKDSCSDIIGSDAAYVLGKLKWTDLSMAYFISQLFAILYLESYFWGLFPILGSLTAIFTLYSLYYQIVVQKKICKLCLAILSVFVLQIFVLLLFRQTVVNVHIMPLIVGFTFLYIIVILTWLYFRSILSNANKDKTNSARLKKMKYDKSVFMALLSNEQQIDEELTKALWLGKAHDASNNFIFFVNLQCEACKKLIREIGEWLKNPYENYSFLLVLSAGDEKNTGRYRLSQYFISEYEKHGAVSAINSVIYWYKKPFKIEINKTSETTQILEEHKRCINYYKIEHSPVVYYNKFRLPIGYTLKDMIFIANI